MSAQELFGRTVTQYHRPSADAKGAERDALLRHAAAGYAQVLRQYRDQPFWCAQALRSLANVRAAQGRFDEAVRLYSRVGQDYPRNDWEVLQAWKSAADLLWDAERRAEAREFYRLIVARFVGEGAAPVTKIILRASERRLVAEGESNAALTAASQSWP
jgi:tetratricopeptide (TPR) repeat protein